MRLPNNPDLYKQVFAERWLKNFCQYLNPKFEFPPHILKIIEYLEKIERGEIDRLIISMPPRHGKQISDSTLVMTSLGWKKHGDLAIGDNVYSPSGKTVTVLAVSKPIKCNARVYFFNGSYIDCHLNHEWTVYDRSSSSWKTVETREFLKDAPNRARYQLPQIKYLEFEEKNLPMHPYVLGAWLGDGTSTSPAISLDKKDFAYIEKIKAIGYKISSTNIHKDTGVLTARFGSGTKGIESVFTKQLKEIGVFKNKHIPEIYKNASKKQRIELLAGLIDTDGHTDKKSRVRIVTCYKKLADDIFEVTTSLGYHPYIMQNEAMLSTSGIQGRKLIYTVGFNPRDKIPVALERKKIKRLPVIRRIGILNAITIPEEELGRCVQVNSSDGLYLVGKEMIPTHNSFLVSDYFPSWYLGKHPDHNIIQTGYSDELANDFGRKVRSRVMDDEKYKAVFDKLQLTRDGNSGGKLSTTEGGTYYAVGRGGAITGRGGHCLDGKTKIVTNKGIQSISSIHDNKNNLLVLSYNHSFDRYEFKKVTHSICLKGVLYEIKTNNGRKVIATSDHRFYSNGKYKKLSSLKSGDELFLLPEGLYSPKIRIFEVFKTRTQRFLLFIRLFSKASCNKKQKKVRCLWRKGRKEIKKILQILQTVCSKKNIERLPVPYMWRIIQAIEQLHGILFKRMCFSRPLFKDERKRKFTLQGWVKLYDIIRKTKAIYKRTRRWQMCSLFKGDGFKSSSHRPQQTKQCSGESNNSMHNPSPVYSQIERCTIDSIKRCSKKQNRVYDIQVEGNHNFFAEGILTHNCIIADDLIKNEEEARSEAIRRMIREWWSTTLYTRLMPGGKIIVVLTRWCEDDIVGHIKAIEKDDPTGKKWVELKLPAINEKNEALWPERYPIDVLLNIRGTLGAANFSALYQQEPMMIEGAMVKRAWIKYYEVLPETFNRYVISCDMAFKESNDSDFVVFQLWAARGAEFYLIDQIRDRMDFPTTLTTFKMFCEKYRKASAKLIEVKANGQAIVDSCKKIIPGIIEINPKESKEARFAACTPMFEAGNIYLPKNKNFTYDYVEEVCGFPRTKHDDMVDCTSQALNWMRENAGSYYGVGVILK